MSRLLSPLYDGDQGPIYRFTLKDGDAPRDMTSAAVECLVVDDNGVSYGKRPGVIISPKSGGVVDVMLKGRETDFDGSPADLFLILKAYYAQAPNRTPAVNLLANQSFDTDSNADGVADSWTLIGAKTGVWAVYANDSAPPSIFGNFQLTSHATVTPLDPDYIQQSGTFSIATGERFSVGCWHRADGATVAQNDNHGIFFRLGTNPNTVMRFLASTTDWYFTTSSVLATQAETLWVVGVDARGTVLSNRYDEAFAFKGRWVIRHSEAFRIPVRRTKRTPKTQNQIAGYHSFEQDSNADGVADGWFKQGSAITYTIEKTPTNVAHGSASQKCVLSDPTSNLLRFMHRGRFKNGETWRASVKVKTSGALTSGSGTGGYNIKLRTDNFDAASILSANSALPTDSGGVFTDHSASLALTADRAILVIDIELNGKSGTLWLDDVRLERTVAAP